MVHELEPQEDGVDPIIRMRINAMFSIDAAVGVAKTAGIEAMEQSLREMMAEQVNSEVKRALEKVRMAIAASEKKA